VGVKLKGFMRPMLGEKVEEAKVESKTLLLLPSSAMRGV